MDGRVGGRSRVSRFEPRISAQVGGNTRRSGNVAWWLVTWPPTFVPPSKATRVSSHMPVSLSGPSWRRLWTSGAK